tara:strand:+ start:1383 stop:1613 length:231 start_codon:yes stop_codon:yes gene_type:complete
LVAFQLSGQPLGWGEGSISIKTEGNNAQIGFEWLFFELKCDSARNQALIRPSLIYLKEQHPTPTGNSMALLQKVLL